MESPTGIDGNVEVPNLTFTTSDDEDGELNPEATKGLAVDPVLSQIYTSKELKERAEEAKEKARKDVVEKLKSAFIFSGVIVAAIGAIFALTKKLRES